MVAVGILVADAADLGQLHVRVGIQVGVLATPESSVTRTALSFCRSVFTDSNM